MLPTSATQFPVLTTVREPQISTWKRKKKKSSNPRLCALLGALIPGSKKTHPALCFVKASWLKARVAHRVRSRPSELAALNSPPAEGNPGPDRDRPAATPMAKYSPGLVSVCLSRQSWEARALFQGWGKKGFSKLSESCRSPTEVPGSATLPEFSQPAARKLLTASIYGLAHHLHHF